MKASLKFREDQKPLFRAKVPLSILGLPFQSGVAAGESKELSLQLSTFFDSGPSLKIAYRPNDPWNPFSFVVKTGTGSFGSPISSSMMMSAEFNLIGQGNPSFFLHFKPQFGDFSIKKSQSSIFENKVRSQPNGVVLDDDNSVEVVERPVVNNKYSTEDGAFSGERITVLAPESKAASVVAGLFSGTEVSARTVLPVRNRAAVKFRWGVRFPAQLRNFFTEEGTVKNRMAGISLQKVPLLVMNKISIEHLDGSDSKGPTNVGPDMKFPGNADVADLCFTVKRQLEALQAENGSLRNAVEDLRSDFAVGKSASPAGAMDSGRYWEGERSRNVKPSGTKIDRRSEKTSSELNGFAGKGAPEGDVNEELKKALMGATGV
ncbi:hypothetical protein L1049_021613 [Liquidambar formosana]|uniref:Uncharacterized protein n=1 Tax=Liquidambar formosana TaxID=63359 RepID=A0AAP0N5I7_LIQFO